MYNLLFNSSNDNCVFVRESFTKVCNGDLSASILLSILENLTTTFTPDPNEIIDGDERIWIKQTCKEFISNSNGMLTANKTKSGLKTLVELGFILKRTHPYQKWNRTIQYHLLVNEVNKHLLAIEENE